MGHKRHVGAVHVMLVSAVVRRAVRRVVCACVRSSSKLLLLWLEMSLLILTPTAPRILCNPFSRVWVQSAPALWRWRWWRRRWRRVARQRRLVFLRCGVNGLRITIRVVRCVVRCLTAREFASRHTRRFRGQGPRPNTIGHRLLGAVNSNSLATCAQKASRMKFLPGAQNGT